MRENNIGIYAGSRYSEATLKGVVTGYPEERRAFLSRYKLFSMKVEHILADGEEGKVTGNILVKLFTYSKRPRVGDEIVIGGELFLPDNKDDDFDYINYLRRRGITAILRSKEGDLYSKTVTRNTPFFVLKRLIYSIRRKADEIIGRYLWGNNREIIRSVILGLRGNIAQETQDIFIKTGTMHILAVSGLHIGIIAGLFLWIFSFLEFPGKTSYLMTIIGICLFAVLAGCRSSSIRAAIMFSFVLINRMAGRKTDILNVLLLSAFFITFFHPSQLFQTGFILSYVAVLSIIFITPITDGIFRINRLKYKENAFNKAWRYFLKLMSLSLAIWIGMMPLVAMYFKIVTLSVIFTNLLAVPVLFVMVVSGIGLLLAGSINIFYPVAGAISLFIRGLCDIFTKTLQMISNIPFLYIKVPSLGKPLILGYYMCLVLIVGIFNVYISKTCKPGGVIRL